MASGSGSGGSGAPSRLSRARVANVSSDLVGSSRACEAAARCATMHSLAAPVSSRSQYQGATMAALMSGGSPPPPAPPPAPVAARAARARTPCHPEIRTAAMALASCGAVHGPGRGRPQTVQTSRTLYAHTPLW